ncbi:transcription initiation protein [Bosea sp. F3-2]|uniref:YciI family protein n=1 Tax=Bosea sp. F3-2 TaxID=2599640 RepID=UPI0011EF36B4|nr:YciI family protein [Bosea sp. F3-2]QEL25483.1 transcription initiation protein [Bosea sp. F3-2]
MPKFVTIGYGDRAGYDRTAPAIRDAAHAQDAALVERGAVIGIAGQPVQVRNPDASGVRTQNGAFMSSQLPVAGFAIIEAADLNEAIDLVSRVPCAIAHGVVEVWPLEEPG